MQLIGQRLPERFPKFFTHRFRGWPGGMTDVESYKFLERHLRETVDQEHVARNTIVFIDDESQTFDENSLSSLTKILVGGGYVILVTAHGHPARLPIVTATGPGEGPPPNWQIGVEGEEAVGILLKKAEAESMVTRVCAVNHARPRITPDLCEFLVNIARGNSGALVALVETIVTNYASILSLSGEYLAY